MINLQFKMMWQCYHGLYESLACHPALHNEVL